jgi:succinoglycan biosynthesis protein ExoA
LAALDYLRPAAVQGPTFPFVSIILPIRNERSFIARTLEAVFSQDYAHEQMEVLVVDGMSDDGTREILCQASTKDLRLRIIDNPGRIVSTGLNAAIRAARGEIILRLDAHTEYAPDYVRQCVAVLSETGADNVGGPWVARGKGYVSRAIAAAFQSPFAVGGSPCHDPGHEGVVDTVYLGCWSKVLFSRIGFFDEELVRNQDDEHNLRLTRAGGKIWQSPRIRSRYRPRGSLAPLFRQYMQYGYWKVRVIQKHKLPASFRHVVPGTFLATLILLAAAAPFSKIALWSSMGLVAPYVVLILAASAFSACRAGISLLPVLPAVFCCYHFGYGYGFLRGMWDHVILQKRPGQGFTDLTRPGSVNCRTERQIAQAIVVKTLPGSASGSETEDRHSCRS